MKLNHIGIPYLAALAFIFGSIVVNGGVSWYRSLAVPSWNPTEGAIAFIWAIIYVCIAWSLLIIWEKFPRDSRFHLVMGTFIAGTVLNLLWSIAFFYLHFFVLSVVLAAALGILVLGLAALVYSRSKLAAVLLLPYAVWVFFAAYLNYAVMLLNP